MEYIWKDRKRHFGLPISFTRYRLTEDRFFCETGFLNLKEEEILLYRIRDISLNRGLFQRLFGVGTIIINSSDKTSPVFHIRNIKNSKQVKELLFEKIELAKKAHNMRHTELLEDDAELDGIETDN